MGDADILFEHRGRLGLITLNRPKALNALTHDMALRLERQLDLWRDDPAVAAVAIRGAGDKAFCAGGDIRALYDAGREDGRNNWQFYADEYRLNTKIKRYSKPYVSIMDGIVMGGGVGVSIHGSHRIITERTVFAMPETGIGLFPDVGATYFLPRMPGQMGMYCGLTGARLKNADAASLLEAMPVPSSALDDLISMLGAGDGLDHLNARDAGQEDLFRELSISGEMAHTDWWVDTRTHLLAADEINQAFGQESVEGILRVLGMSGTEWGTKLAETILAKSPTCTRIAFRQIREGATFEFEDCMRLEYRLARFCMTQPDFYEGVRAVILDKDNAPKWNPATLAEADDAHVAPAFKPLDDEELVLG
jgi:enoyl-CoA hydratase